MADGDKPLIWFRAEVKTPPFSEEARIEAGMLLRQLQGGIKLSMPQSRPMPTIGARCHELRVQDENATWRIVYRIDADAIVIVDVFQKDSQSTPKLVIANCERRLSEYDRLFKEKARKK
ncbi:MAG TPA: type II toxin-antitoxin system RelE/ParE family toxin [Casimicrobiaceae bacterium]|jgi:phage-related protein